MPLNADDLVAALEAVIFVSSEPVTPQLLREVFPDESEADLEAAVARLAKSYEEPGRGLLLDRVAGGWRIATRPDVHGHVGRVVQREKAERLSVRTLETLSVVAYKQPVTAAEIAEIRGVDVSGTLRTLLDRGLIRIAGRKRVVGRPFVYGSTKKFLTTFGLNDLSELPTLKELEELVTDIPTTLPSEVEPDDGAVAEEGSLPLEDSATSAGAARSAAAGSDWDREAVNDADEAVETPSRARRGRSTSTSPDA